MVLKLHYDGEKISVPEELRGRGPLELEATVLDPTLNKPQESMAAFLERVSGSLPRTQDEVLQILRDMRDGRDDER